MLSSVTVSIVIPSYNSAATIEGVVSAILKQSAIGSVREILVVDSSQDEYTRRVLATIRSELVTVISLDEQVMPAVARNIGARRATGGLIVFIDSDVFPEHGWLESIIRATGDGCRAGTGSLCLCAHQEGRPVAVAQYYLQLNEYLPVGRRRTIRFPSGSNMFCERSLYHDVGGIPEIRASEEVVFGLNLSRLTPIWFVPDATGGHVFREEWGDFFRNQLLLGKYISAYRKAHKDTLLLSENVVFALSPLIALMKTLLIMRRIGGCGREHVIRFVSALPAVMLGIVFWTAGFVVGCRRALIYTEEARNAPADKHLRSERT